MGRKNRFLLKELKKWQKDNLITDEQFETLSKRYRDDYIDWQPIIKAIRIMMNSLKHYPKDTEMII